jgi:phospholipid transport system substrate-binding protein
VNLRPGRAIAMTAAVLLLAPAGASRTTPADVAAPVTAAQGEGPHELMTGLSTRLFSALDRDRSRIRRQPERVLPLVDELLSPCFDAEYTAHLVLGAHWHEATPEQRDRFARALYRTLLWTYAGAVAEWTPDRLRILPPRGDPAALQTVVRTEVARPGAAVVPVDYRLHRTADGWKVFDVVVDGVSYVRTYHDDIDGEIAHKGLDAAIERLERRRTGTAAPVPRR